MNSAATHKQLAVLIDPDKTDKVRLQRLLPAAVKAGVDFFLVGGSLLTTSHLEEVVVTIKKKTRKKVYLFPGNPMQICPKADGILLLSLISGRNPELLIGYHVQAAPLLKQSKLDIIPTGYLLIDGGKPTTVSYISNTTPIPADKPELAACTALAGEQLGLQTIYLEAGSGALHPVSADMIKAVRKQISVPLIVGGGIRSAAQAEAAFKAGADIVVIGTALEQDASLLKDLQQLRRQP